MMEDKEDHTKKDKRGGGKKETHGERRGQGQNVTERTKGKGK